MRLVLILVASSLLASQSFVLQSGRRVTVTFPGGSPMCQNVTAFRAEGQFQVMTPPVSGSWIVRQDTGWGLNLDGSGNLGTYILNAGGGPSINIAGWTYIRWRFRRDTVAVAYTIEAWNEQTGERRVATQADPNPGSNNPIGCAFYTGGQGADVPTTANIGAVRIYSSAGALDAAPPPRLLTSGFADLLDLEYEGNLNDSSGRGLNGTMSLGSAGYATTAVLPPVLSLSSPVSVKSGAVANISSSCISNEDVQSCTIEWNQAAGPALVRLSSYSGSSTSFSGIVFGQYDFTGRASTTTQSASTSFSVGVSVQDSRGAIVWPNATAEWFLRGSAGYGGNLWPWYDDRAVRFAELQINMLNGTNGSPPFWANNWSTNLGGTITLVNGSNVVTGSGTQFQTDFCGGAGNTSPTSKFGKLYAKYEAPEYPGETTLAVYTIASCNSQTQLTLNNTWIHGLGTQAGRNYTRCDDDICGGWTFSPSPGNYYDNVLAFYYLYYATGLTKYRDAARTLARNWWEGPFYGRGRNYISGSFISAGPARGQSLTGLFLWALETGENIWPGMANVMSYQKGSGWDYYNNRGWTTPQLGDIREQAYLTAGYALNAKWNPNGTTRSDYLGYLRDYINLLWQPRQLANGGWQSTSISNLNISGGSNRVRVTNGSTSITLLGGGTWGVSDFCINDCPGAGNYQARVWFFTNASNSELPGNSNADLGGDSTFYRVTNVTSSTTATLDRAYEGTSGDKGAIVSNFAGFGVIPFMQGILNGVFGGYAYQTLTDAGATAEAAKARQFSIDGSSFLFNSSNYDSSINGLYGGSYFLNCVAAPNSSNCAGGSILNSEAVNGWATAYGHSGSASLKTSTDTAFAAIWCAQPLGFACPSPGYLGYYGDYFRDPPQGFYLNPGDYKVNKWFGYKDGYGFGSKWSVATQGGALPQALTTRTLQYTPPAGSTSTVIRVMWPDGTPVDTSCSAGLCTFQIDARQGTTFLWQFRHSGPSGFMGAGQLQPLTL